ncbi:hypothetical protein NQ156_00805 [Microbacterium sp. zg.Y625]|uniref:hypothetical protein n=1 Tax=Microbacterium jiangjiandongii TaxID=3049071 RepID=UPI00214B8BDD|nr:MULTISPECIES: hypothetical protein [unclassified Microbacterium]MCR2791599.1 hypothetical protein [Microbacterium sp. zg.Y625]MCR2817131.1 hypothetical protein [Microbacterium sp. zg.Y843]WIM24423.1 hypothetical protein QNO14_09715 [Microbacterium sp. zg-Y625]
MTRRLSDTTATLTGLALITLPALALLLKLASPGWMVFGLLVTAPLWILGYAVQMAVAVSGYFISRGALREGPVATRGLVYSWATSVAVVFAGFFLVDGGDTGHLGSTFMLWTGLAGDSGAADLSSAIFSLAVFVWLVTWACLVVEWIIALVRRRRASRAASRPSPATVA